MFAMFKKKTKVPSPLIRFLKDAFQAVKDHFAYIKAQNELERLEYSVDFVVSLMKKASQPGLKVTFTNVQGITLVFEALGKPEPKAMDPLSTQAFADYMSGKL